MYILPHGSSLLVNCVNMRRGHWRVFWQTSRIYMLTNYTLQHAETNNNNPAKKTVQYKRIFMKVVNTFILYVIGNELWTITCVLNSTEVYRCILLKLLLHSKYYRGVPLYFINPTLVYKIYCFKMNKTKLTFSLSVPSGGS